MADGAQPVGRALGERFPSVETGPRPATGTAGTPSGPRVGLVRITARHCEVPEPVRRRAVRKVGTLARYVPALTGAHLVVTREHSRYEAELILTAARLRIVGKAMAMDPASAVDEAVGRVAQRLRREHARRQDRLRRVAQAQGVVEP